MHLLRPFAILILLGLAIPTNALYFYMEGVSPKCFYEELPKDTMVVGPCLDAVLYMSNFD